MSLIVTTSPTFATVGDLPVRIEAAGFTLHRRTRIDASYRESLADAAYLVAGLPPVTSETLSSAPNLRGILKHGVGFDTIDVAAATDAGIPVTTTPGANAQSVAEMTFGAIFALSRNVIFGHQTVTSGDWVRRRGREVSGLTLGILGFGQIGQTLARLARGIGMEVLAHDPSPASDTAAVLHVGMVGFDELLSRSDIVSLHIAATAETDNIIDAATLKRMKPGAKLINFARGSLVDLDALAAALECGHLSGAAIDAYPTEPPDTAHPIFSAPNMLFSPHSGADTVEAIARMSNMVFEAILGIESGRVPSLALNAEALRNRP